VGRFLNIWAKLSYSKGSCPLEAGENGLSWRLVVQIWIHIAWQLGILIFVYKQYERTSQEGQNLPYIISTGPTPQNKSSGSSNLNSRRLTIRDPNFRLRAVRTNLTGRIKTSTHHQHWVYSSKQSSGSSNLNSRRLTFRDPNFHLRAVRTNLTGRIRTSIHHQHSAYSSKQKFTGGLCFE